ncbi:MAG: Endoglucanase precursor [Labilithrix sp.]|nr:Endoglucanase precursor [Labilithrix sp.]
MRSGVRGFIGVALFSCAACSRALDPPAPQPQTAAAPASAAALAVAAAPPADPHVRVIGRFERSAGAVRFAWPGSTVTARFKGTAISARLKDDGKNFFQVIIDGEPKAVLRTAASKDTYVLATGLPDAIHDVALFRRTEARLGETVFLGFDPVGTMLPAPPPAERRIEYIGDSITAGYGNEGPNAQCTFNPAEENHYQTYAAITARELRAEHVTIAWSAQTIGQMTDYYERAVPQRPDSTWDFASWVPQVVVMNIGTNNFATYDPTETRYVRIYSALFDRVRRAYPRAFIVCALGPMLTDIYPPGKRNLTLARKYMAATMEKIRASGETNFQFVEFPEQNHANGLGCGFHPSLKTHKLMAEKLAPIIREKMAW